MNGIKVKFWGVRGSFPIPRSDDAFGGNTSCIEIRSNKNEIVILDMGTGLRVLGDSIIKNDTDIKDKLIDEKIHYHAVFGFDAMQHSPGTT